MTSAPSLGPKAQGLTLDLDRFQGAGQWAVNAAVNPLRMIDLCGAYEVWVAPHA